MQGSSGSRAAWIRLGCGVAGLALACERGEAGATVASAEPLACPAPATVRRIDFPDERGGGFAERCVLQDGVSRHGPSREWGPDGKRRALTHWWQGVRHGKTTFWYPSGRKRNEAEHYRWQPTGVWTSWDEQGKVTDQRDFGPPHPEIGSWPMPELGEAKPPEGQAPDGTGAADAPRPDAPPTAP